MTTDSGVPNSLSRLVRWTTRRLATKENITYGRDLRVGRSVVLSAPHRLVIGDWVAIGPRTMILCDGSIGDFVLIGMNVQIAGRDDHDVTKVGTPIKESAWVGSRASTARDVVTIKRDVWVGGGSTILSGVVIGEGAIVGASSVVTKDVPPFTIVAGNPAAPIGQRFADKEMVSEHKQKLDRLASQRRRASET